MCENDLPSFFVRDNEAKMIQDIVNDVLDKLHQMTLKTFFGIEDNITKMSLLLRLESKEVKMVGIWGPSFQELYLIESFVTSKLGFS